VTVNSGSFWLGFSAAFIVLGVIALVVAGLCARRGEIKGSIERYDYTPSTNTAQKMAETFGPDWSPGDVINHWLERVQARAEAKAS
jgi:hypothetical protein